MRKATFIYKNLLQTNFEETLIKEIEQGLLSTMETCIVPRTLFGKIQTITENQLTELYNQFQLENSNVPPLEMEKQVEWDYSRLEEWTFPLVVETKEEEKVFKKKSKIMTPQKIQKQKKKELTSCGKYFLSKVDDNLLRQSYF